LVEMVPRGGMLRQTVPGTSGNNMKCSVAGGGKAHATDNQ